MAIQPVNLGAPVTGVGGDDYRQAHTKINANFVEVGVDIVALKAKDVTQDTAIGLSAVKTEVASSLALKADKTAVNSKNTLQDDAISLRATIESVDAKNSTQDAAITDLQLKDAAQDSSIALKANTVDVDSKNTLQDAAISDLQAKDLTQDAAINLRATIVSVDDKNTLQDSAITAVDTVAKAAIPNAQKGAASGVATLGLDGKVPASQLPPAAAGVTVVDTTGSSTTSAISQRAATAIDTIAKAAIPKTQLGANNGVATLGTDGKVPATQLPVVAAPVSVVSTEGQSTTSAASQKLATTISAAQNATDIIAKAAIPSTQKGAINGIASLGSDGKVMPSQLPAAVAPSWGGITGSIAAQTDLNATFATKAELGQSVTAEDLNKIRILALAGL